MGGAVRDDFLGVEVEDKDYCVTGVTRANFEREFEGRSCKERTSLSTV